MLDSRFYISSKPLSLGELIAPLEAQLADDKFSDEMIESVADLATSQPKQIAYLENKRHKAKLTTAKATACFVPEALAALVSEQRIIPIISKFPRAHFSRVISQIVRERTRTSESGLDDITPSAKVHSTAIIGPGSWIGQNVEIAPYAIIGPGVKIGASSFIGAHSHIQCAVIGEHCHIKAHAVIGGSGFGVTNDENGILNIPHIGRVLIGDRVSIGSQSCVDRGQLGDTILGDDVKVDNLVQIAHNVAIGAGTVIAGHVGISGSVAVGRGVQLGGNVGLADHITVGDGASIAARSGVMHDVPAGEVWSGIPALPIREHMRIVSATRRLAKKPKKES